MHRCVAFVATESLHVPRTSSHEPGQGRALQHAADEQPVRGGRVRSTPRREEDSERPVACSAMPCPAPDRDIDSARAREITREQRGRRGHYYIL